MDPSIIMRAMDDMQDWLEQTQSQIEEHVNDRIRIQQLGEEYAQRSAQRLMIRQNEAEEDKERLDEFHTRAREAINLAEHYVDVAITALKRYIELAQEAEQNRAFWFRQEELATAWVFRATNRVNAAVAWVNSAQQTVNACEREYEYRKSELYRAQRTTKTVRTGTDRDGRAIYREVPIDTRPYEIAVERAADALNAAYAELNRAKQELAAAEEELQQAQIQLNGTVKALNEANEGLKEAQAAVEYGKSANKYADISFDATKQAEKLAYKAVEHIELALSYLETAKVDQSKVEGELTNAHTLLGQTIAESDKTNSDSHNARESLNEKLELLQRFNRTGGIA